MNGIASSRDHRPTPGAIHATDLSFTYEGRTTPAFTGVSFEVSAGQCLLIVGASGSGKSTLALAIAGLVPRDLPGRWSGRLEVNGLNTVNSSPHDLSAQVGIVFQDPESQIVMDRVEDDVAFGLENRAWPLAKMQARVPQVLSALGMLPLARRRSTQLSGGQQQRLALAGVLAPNPSILVLDEPTANLDPEGTQTFFEQVQRLRKDRSVTLVLIEHRIALAWPLADRVLVLGRSGAPIDFGPPEAVLERSRHLMESEGIWLPDQHEAGRGEATGQTLVPVSRATGDSPPLATLSGVSFAYDPRQPVLDNLTLKIMPGERIALLGPNGSGKSTLCRLLVGLLKPTRGTVQLAGTDPARLSAKVLSSLAGYVFQDPERQFLMDTVRREVLVGLPFEQQDAAEGLMSTLGLPLDAYGDRSPYTLSWGEKRRLSLGCMLVRRPRLLVLDEPTFGQDRLGYERLLEILHHHLRSGTTVIAATHDLRFVRDFATHSLVLQGGKVSP